MPASNTDKFRKKRSNFSTTLNGGIGSSDATITLSSTSGLPTDTAITLTIDRVDANGVSTPTKMERVTGVISSNQITTALRGVDNSPSAQSHLSGAVVEDIWDALSWNDHVDGHLVEHNQDGTHKNTIVSLLAVAQTFTAIKTFTTGLLKAADIIDTVNALKVLIFTGVASAVNQLTITNAATGGSPVVGATGSDTNIGLIIRPKGSGVAVTDGALNYGADAGANDTYAITVTGLSAYVTGMTVVFKANTANTGACSLNINALGAIPIKKQKDQDPADADIKAGQIVVLTYDGTNFQMQSQIANSPASQTFAAYEVESLAQQNTTGTTFADMSGITQSVVLAVKSHVFVYGHSQAKNTNAGSYAYLHAAYNDGTDHQIGGDSYTQNATETPLNVGGFKLNLAAGTYTFKLQNRVSANTGNYWETTMAILVVPAP